MPNNPKMCPMPFTSLHIEPDGRIKICCHDNPKEVPLDNNGKPYNVTTHKLKEFWNSDYIKSVRQEFINGGQPSSCKKCWETELIGDNSASVRTAAIDRLKKHNFNYSNIIDNCTDGELKTSPVDFQIMVGNLCNLGCKMCGSDYSTNFSKFFKSKGFETLDEVKFHSNQPDGYFEYSKKSYGVNYDWPKTIGLSKIFSEYEDDIIELFITGGEPTIVAENIEFLKDLGEKLNTKERTIQIATNCTNVNKNLISILSNFKVPRVHCSIDGMNEIAAIQRTYSDWSQIEKNFKMLYNWSLEKSNREVYIHSVLTALNLHHMVDFWNYIFKNYPHISISYLPIIDRNTPVGLELIPKRFKHKLLKQIVDCYSNNKLHKILHHYLLNLENYVKTINFSESDKNFFEMLDFIQQLHPEYNIKEIYQFYYD